MNHWKAKGLDLAPVLFVPELPEGAARRGVVAQDHGLDKALDNKLIELAAAGAGSTATQVRAELDVRNDHRSVGAMLGGEVTRRYGGNGLPDDTIAFTLRGTGGQSFGAFLPRGVTLRLIGDTNDYVAKGLSGGRVIVRPARATRRSSPRRTSSPATPSCTARPPARCSCAAGPASGSRCATPAPPRSSRASATTAAST